MVKIFLDGASLNTMESYWSRVAGFTSNPSLMKAQGMSFYSGWAQEACAVAKGKPVSFEVLSDDYDGIIRQARIIASWGDNVYVKIPCLLSNGTETASIIHALQDDIIKVNVTAICSLAQCRWVARTLRPGLPSIMSIFAGRIADTGRDPVPFITAALHTKPASTEILWASTREVYNVKQAEQAGAAIITCSPQIIEKMSMFGKDLDQLSRETVQQFVNDGKGFSL